MDFNYNSFAAAAVQETATDQTILFISGQVMFVIIMGITG